LQTLSFTTDNKAINKDMTKQLDILDELLEAKQLFFEGLKNEFSVQHVLELRAKSAFLAKEKPKKQPKMIVNTTSNVELFELLRTLRNDIAQREDLVHFQVFTQKSLYAMCEMLPTSKQELKAIHGMGKTRIEKYGTEILEVIKNYCEENDVEISQSAPVFEVSKPKRQKGDTKKVSLELFKTGKSLEEIAEYRELNPNTIFGHLASFIPSGEVKVTDLMPESHYAELKAIIPTKTFENLSDLKHQIDDKYSYAELRLVVNELSKH
ncbi:MAG: helix-turn-helix domain-containing protein, partial [Bacteroidota bacterium]